MSRKLVISDIHGQYSSMMKLFEYINLDLNKDTLHVIGDLINRGPDSGPVVKEIESLQSKYKDNVKVIIGNHEIMMREYVFESKSLMWLNHGGYGTIESFNNTFKDDAKERDRLLTWLANLPLFHSDDEYFFCHAGIDFSFDLDEQDSDITYIEPDESYLVSEDDITDLIGDKKIVHGHTPYKTVYDTGRFISCDTGSSILDDGCLSVVDLTNNVYYSCEIETGFITKRKIENKDLFERVREYSEWKDDFYS